MAYNQSTEDVEVLRRMLDIAALQTGRPVTEILSQNRNVKLVRIRQIIALAAHRRGFSWADIGRVLERDAKTVQPAAKAAERRHG